MTQAALPDEGTKSERRRQELVHAAAAAHRPVFELRAA
jgi:hypothetical protein